MRASSSVGPAYGKRRVRMELTPSQREAMAKADAEVERERRWIDARSAEARKKHDAQVQRLASRLREARQSAGLSLTQLSERTGMTRQAISRIESVENRILPRLRVELPFFQEKPVDFLEVLIAGYDRQRILLSDRRNPNVI